MDEHLPETIRLSVRGYKTLKSNHLQYFALKILFGDVKPKSFLLKYLVLLLQKNFFFFKIYSFKKSLIQRFVNINGGRLPFLPFFFILNFKNI